MMKKYTCINLDSSMDHHSSGVRTLKGNYILPLSQYDGTKPLLVEPLYFAALTGDGAAPKGKEKARPGIKDRHAHALWKQTKRKQLEKDQSIEAWVELQRMSPIPEEDLEPLETRVLVCNNVYESCPFRALAAYNTSYGYRYVAFPTRDDMVDTITQAAISRQDNYWFPIVEFDYPIYWFVDFDEDRQPKPSQSKNEKEYFQRCVLGMRFLRRCAEYLYGGISITRAGKRPCEPYYYSACGERKFSFHAHLKLAFESVRALRKVMEFAREQLEKAPKDCALVRALKNANPKSDAGNPWIIDFPIYHGDRNFRGCHQIKHGKTQADAMVPWDGCKKMEGLDDKAIKKWVKRSMIMLKKDQHTRILTLPDPPAANPPWRASAKDLPTAMEEVRATLYGKDDPESLWALAQLRDVPRDVRLMPLVMQWWQRDRSKALPPNLFQTLRELGLTETEPPPTGEELLRQHVLRPCFETTEQTQPEEKKNNNKKKKGGGGQEPANKKAKPAEPKKVTAPLAPPLPPAPKVDGHAAPAHLALMGSMGSWQPRILTKVHGYQ